MRTLLLILLSALAAPAAMVQLSWTHSESPDVAGYRLYWGTNSSNYVWRANVPYTNAWDIAGLINGRNYYFTMTATNVWGESRPCVEAVLAVPQDWPPDPVLLVKPTLMATTNLSATWTNLQDWPEIVVPTTDKEVYFKLKLEIK